MNLIASLKYKPGVVSDNLNDSNCFVFVLNERRLSIARFISAYSSSTLGCFHLKSRYEFLIYSRRNFFIQWVLYRINYFKSPRSEVP